MEPGRVTLELRGSWLWVWTPVDRDAFVDELERRVPDGRRSWEATAAAWQVHVAYTDLVLALLHKHFPDGTRADEDAEPGGLAEAFDELHLAATAPTEVVDAAYRALLSIYRSEGTSGAACVARVTEAYATIRRWQLHRDQHGVRALASTPWSTDGA